MLIKISLVFAIIVSLATLYLAHDQVGGKLTSLATDLGTAQAEATTAKTEATKAINAEKSLKSQLESTNKMLVEVTAVRDMALARSTEQETRANKSAEALAKTTEEKNAANSELSAWKSLNMSVDQIRPQRDALAKAQAERDVLQLESKVLSLNTRMLKAQLDKYKGTEEVEVVLPAGTKGEIVAVDPKFDFVVLNIGANQGVLPNAKLLVNRNGKLIAKVKITSVEPTRSIANVLSDWKQDELSEGDQVFY